MRTPAGEAGPVLLFQLLPLVGAMRTGGHRPFRGRRTVVTPRRGDEDTHSLRDLDALPTLLPLVGAMRPRRYSRRSECIHTPGLKLIYQQTSGRALDPGESLKTAPQAHCAPFNATLSKAYPRAGMHLARACRRSFLRNLGPTHRQSSIGLHLLPTLFDEPPSVPCGRSTPRSASRSVALPLAPEPTSKFGLGMVTDQVWEWPRWGRPSPTIQWEILGDGKISHRPPTAVKVPQRNPPNWANTRRRRSRPDPNYLDTVEVTGSNPVSPTSITAGQRPSNGRVQFFFIQSVERIWR